MNDRPTPTKFANELARERNREAAERTLMAWIRTALSLIGFGFGIAKLDEYLHGGGLHTQFDIPHSTLILVRALLSWVFSVCSPRSFSTPVS
jgi:uncharacterized membrane protein YidH (DUF202 family)